MEDEPKTVYGDKPKPALKKKQVLWVLMGGLCLIVLFFFFAGTPKKPSGRVEVKGATDEQKNLYSRAEIENLIKEKALEETDKKEIHKQQQTAVVSKRTLNSPIAVFVEEKEKPKPREVRQEKAQGLNIATGVKVKAHLANAIFSFNVSSPVVAITDEDLKKDDVVILPKNTQFVGDAAILKSRDRVNVKFSTMVLPDGKELNVRAMALGLDGSGGVKGKVDKQYDKSLLRAAGETALAGAAVVLGVRDRPLTLTDELRLNAARNLTDDARDALNDVKVEESITVEAYTPILVLFLDSI